MHKPIYRNTKRLLLATPLLLLSPALSARDCEKSTHQKTECPSHCKASEACPGDKPSRRATGCPGEARGKGKTITEEVAFLGVYTTKVHPTATHQLGFPKGFYLTVQHVEPGSPAEEAGLEAHDILQKVEDQILINPEQLRELIRSKEAGTNVGITYFREGKERTASAKLATRKISRREGFEQFPQGDFEQFQFPRHFKDFEDLKRRIPREALPEGFRGKAWEFKFDSDPFDPAPGKGGQNFQSNSQTHVSSGEQSTIQVNNNNGSLYLEMNDGKGHLTIRDKSGKNLYDGDYKPGQKIKGLSKQWQSQLQEIDIQLKKDCKDDKEKADPKKGEERRSNKDKKNK